MNLSPVYVNSSSSVFGARRVSPEDVDRAYGMPSGKLRKRAGIESFAYAAADEDEGSLGEQACRQALNQFDVSLHEVDWILAASETYHAFPTLSAVLHSRLGLRENCNALDVGSGCLALLQTMAVAQSLLQTGRGRNVLVATADVHSRTLGPGRAAGEFGGLFGDGACAFLLSGDANRRTWSPYRLGDFFFGCATKYSQAIAISDSGNGPLDVKFSGDALSRAAVACMEKVLGEVEHRSGISRRNVGTFATHQPNPRLVALLVKQLDVPARTFPLIGATSGNLGSSMCGAVLHAALDQASTQPFELRQPVFLASLGPGLLYGGGWMVPAAP